MLVALDTETAAIEGDLTAPPITCVQLCWQDQATILPWHRAGRFVEIILRDRSIQITGAEIAFDMCAIMAEWPHLTQLVFQAYEDDRVTDILIDHKLLDLADGILRYRYALDEYAPQLNKATPWRGRFGELRDVAIDLWPEEARTYAIEDAKATYAIAKRIPGAFIPDRYRQARASFWLKLASNRGLRVDPEKLAAFKAGLEMKLAKNAEVLLAEGLLRKEKKGLVRNEKSARERFGKICAADIPWTTRGPSLRAEYLLECDDPVLQSYANYSQTLKRLRNDIPALSSPHRLHTHFDSLKLNGRTGSAKPNLQNLDVESGIRECVVPEEGYVFASADYSKNELCAWAQVCLWLFGESSLVDTLRNGGDPHNEIAALITDDSDPYWKRQCGKGVNFGCPGGLGPKSLVAYAKQNYGVKLTEYQARKLRDIWRKVRPEHKKYFAYVDAQGETAVQFESGRIRGGCGFTDHCNTLFSGLAADAGKDAGFALAKACYVDTRSPLYGSHIVNYIHDEFQTEVPIEQAAEAAEEQARIMEEVAAKWMPDVPPKAEPLLARFWSKNNKPIRDGYGRLCV